MNAKSSDIQAGYIARNSIWDKLVWSGLRNNALDGIVGDSLRSLIVIGGRCQLDISDISAVTADNVDAPSSSAVAWSTALLSLPTSRLFSSPFSAGPVLSSHFYDIQSLPSYLLSPPSAEGDASHTGAPGCNVEVVLRGVVDINKEGRGRPKEGTGDGSEAAMEGTLYARGPGMGAVLGQEGDGANEG
jgi:long-chain acyl-CoA synthetase